MPPTEPPQRKPTGERRSSEQRTVLSFAALLLASCAIIASLAYRWGASGETQKPWQRLSVGGSSMAPMFWGQSVLQRCDHCRQSWRFDAAQTTSSPLCWHCGKQIPPTSPIAVEPDTVEITPQGLSGVRRGDVVAVRWGNQLHLKRIVGIPSDTIDLSGLRLMVGNERLEDVLSPTSVLPWIPVDHDALRDASRWRCDESPTSWTRSRERSWRSGKGTTPWLIYHHQSVHDHGRPSRVWDDYPMNVGLQRKLHGVDRFCLRGVGNGQDNINLEIAFWTTEETRIATLTLTESQVFSVSVHDAAARANLPVTAENPVAIRVLDGPVTIGELSLARLVEYRLRPHDERTHYPLTVPAEHYFVLGDNVPVSVDSREVGLIPITSVLGTVDRGGTQHSAAGARASRD